MFFAGSFGNALKLCPESPIDLARIVTPAIRGVYQEGKEEGQKKLADHRGKPRR